MTLRSTISTAEGKRRYVRRLFATIADRYDLITVLLSYGLDRRWKRRLIELAAVGPVDRVLDLACGTGDLLFAAAEKAQRAVGVDLTYRMLQLAERRAAATPPRRRDGDPGAEARPTCPGYGKLVGRPFTGRQNVALIAGDMLALPFSDARFDVITTGYGLRNMPDLRAALVEIHRVLARGGRFVSLDFNRPDHPLIRVAYLAYLTVVGSALGLVLHRDPDTYRYIPESIRLYPGAEAVAELMREVGFGDVRVVPLLGGLMSMHTARKRA